MLSSSSTASTSALRILSRRAASKQAERPALPGALPAGQITASSSRHISSQRSTSPQLLEEYHVSQVRSAVFDGRQYLLARPQLPALLWSLVSRIFPPSSPSAHSYHQSPQLALASPGLNALAEEARENNGEEAGSSSLWNWNGLLWAVPKKKVSHSRKAMRSANKGLKDRVGEFIALANTIQMKYSC